MQINLVKIKYLNERIDEAIYDITKDFSNCADPTIARALYYRVFGIMPGGEYEFNDTELDDVLTPVNDDRDNEKKYKTSFDVTHTYKYLMKKYAEECRYVYLAYCDMFIFSQGIILIAYDNKFHMFCAEPTLNEYDNKLIKNLQKNIKEYNYKKDKAWVEILCNARGSYVTKSYELPEMDVDIDKLYNDDLPAERINEFVESDETGLLLFYGEPGTGKTTFIKHLASEHPDKTFIILDSNVLIDITSHSLLQAFLENRDAVWILEDCEKLLVSRDESSNPIMSAFLNMSDGILASVLKCKFICTFNTSIENIDSALMRKGRMKIKYEFKKLDKKKAQAINPEVTEDITLADLFYLNNENDFSKKQRNKIGF